MSADGKSARGRTIILTDSDRKGSRKEVLANNNKTRIDIGHHHDHWMHGIEGSQLSSTVIHYKASTNDQSPLQYFFGGFLV